MAACLSDRLLTHRHTTLPLVRSGRPTGLVTVARIREIPEGARTVTTLGDIARPLSQVPVAPPDDALVDLLPRLNGAADRRALVVADGPVVGIVAPIDISRAVESRQPGQPTPAGIPG